MSSAWWKVLVVVALVAFPVAYVVGDLTGRSEPPPTRPEIVLGSRSDGPSAAPSGSPSGSPGRGSGDGGTSAPSPGGSGAPKPSSPRPTAGEDDDGVLVVRPRPEDVGDHGDDDGDDRADRDDRDDRGDDDDGDNNDDDA